MPNNVKAANFNLGHIANYVRSIPNNIRAQGLATQQSVAHLGGQIASSHQAAAKAMPPSMIPGTGMPTPVMSAAPALPTRAAAQATAAGAQAARSRLGFGSGAAAATGVLGLGALGYAASQPAPPYNNTGGMSY